MWSLVKKKPLNPTMLPVADKWQMSRGIRSGKPMLVRTHAGYSDFSGVAGFEHQVGIAVPLHDADTQGLPKTEETEELNSIENEICTLMEPQNESLLVAAITCGGIREFVLYTSNPEAVKRKFKMLQRRTLSHNVHLRIQLDKEWSVYAQLV
jgi:Family of unknown function (DUF695)